MERSELRLCGFPKEVNAQLTIIAKNIGVTKSELLRPKIREIINSFPEEYRTKEINSPKKSELSITAVPDDLIDGLNMISKNLGVSPVQLMRIKLIEMTDDYPEHLKRSYE
jgi:hypothetical protein